MYQGNARVSARPPSLEEYQSRVREFLARAPFAQVITVNLQGYPVARTMVAPPEDDWSVYLVQRNVHHRIEQWRRNPRTEIVWVGHPHGDNRNLAPHVYDWCVQVPRVVFVRGEARFLDDDATVEAYERQMRRNIAAGRTLAPERNREQVLDELIGVKIEPVRVRAEGFGPGPESFSWEVDG